MEKRTAKRNKYHVIKDGRVLSSGEMRQSAAPRRQFAAL